MIFRCRAFAVAFTPLFPLCVDYSPLHCRLMSRDGLFPILLLRHAAIFYAARCCYTFGFFAFVAVSLLERVTSLLLSSPLFHNISLFFLQARRCSSAFVIAICPEMPPIRFHTPSHYHYLCLIFICFATLLTTSSDITIRSCHFRRRYFYPCLRGRQSFHCRPECLLSSPVIEYHYAPPPR